MRTDGKDSGWIDDLMVDVDPYGMGWNEANRAWDSLGDFGEGSHFHQFFFLRAQHYSAMTHSSEEISSFHQQIFLEYGNWL